MATMKSKMKPLAATIFAAGVVVAAPSMPAGATVVEQQVTSMPGRSIHGRKEAAISTAAARVLRHIAQARTDIRRGNFDAAGTNLTEADTLLDFIEASLPTTTARHHIWVAKKHLEYKDADEVLPDLISIDSALDELVDYTPVKKAKSHLAQTHGHLKKGDKGNALKALEATEAALVYSEYDLPLNSTRQLVSRAEDELNSVVQSDVERLDTVDQALKAAEDNMVFLSANIDEPLVPAKSSVWHALLAYAAGDSHTAKAQIHKAIGYLEREQEEGDQESQGAAKSLEIDAKALAGTIEDHPDDAASRLDALWQRVQALTDRAIELLTTDLDRLRIDSPLKSHLIEAKLHLTYAEIDEFTANKTREADKELGIANQHLSQAAEKARGMEKIRIAEIQEGIKAIGSHESPHAIEADYDYLKSQLRALIQAP